MEANSPVGVCPAERGCDSATGRVADRADTRRFIAGDELAENKDLMGKLFLSALIGFVSGVICFFLSVALLCFVLLAIRGLTSMHPDMTLAYKAAAPVAILAAFSGFTITLVRAVRGGSPHSKLP